ncbi:MAG: glycosyltransferase family 4 protein [Candidatus Micrarchaeia archaeon]
MGGKSKNISVLMIDIGSRFGMVSGEARMASILLNGLKNVFDVSYLGYETMYISKIEKGILLSRNSSSCCTEELAALKKHLIEEGNKPSEVRDMINAGLDKKEYFETLKKGHFDVVISNSAMDLPIINYLKRANKGIKVIYVDHESVSMKIKIPEEEQSPQMRAKMHGIKFLNSFDMCIATSIIQMKSLRRYTKKVVCIPNAIDANTKHNKAAEEKIRLAFNISSDDFVVLYVGKMLESQKNVSTLIKAFKKLSHSDMKLVLAGEGPSIEDYIASSMSDKRITVTGMLTDEMLEYLYNVSNCFVLPSKWEGSSITIIEAAKHNLPIIVSEAVHMADMYYRHIYPFTFKAGDHVKLASLIEAVYSNAAIREKAIEVSEKIKKAYSEEKMVSMYAKVIKELTSSHE